MELYLSEYIPASFTRVIYDTNGSRDTMIMMDADYCLP